MGNELDELDELDEDESDELDEDELDELDELDQLDQLDEGVLGWSGTPKLTSAGTGRQGGRARWAVAPTAAAVHR